MKNKTWIIVLIMGLGLAISIIYSLILNHKINNIEPEKIVTSTSIVQTTVSRVSIENTLSGNGKIIKDQSNAISNIIDESGNVVGVVTDNRNVKINLTIDKKDKDKLKENQEVQISENNQNQNNKKYNGVITTIEEKNDGTFNINVKFEEDVLLENETIVTSKVIIEKAEDVIAVPIDAIQTNNQNEKYVIVINEDGTTTDVKVETGISDPSYTEITKGLVGGEKIQLTTSTTVTSDKENQTK